ncbi:MAG: helix-turn-helix domain-containing protein [Candidatus Omnitrophica bacterium]|nr:helix-turn-helix domain-containing protein [Candidatus Omnitrophota bacterium]
MRVKEHLKEKLKDPYFKELYELEEQKLSIVKQIINYRIKNKLTQKQLAEKARVTQQHISKIENGEFSSIMTLEKVLLMIGLTVKIKTVPVSQKVRNRMKHIIQH